MFLDPQTWLTLLILIMLELVLGVDNLVFLSVISSRLPLSEQKKARRLGLSLALIMRLVLLALAFLLVQLSKPLFSVLGHYFSIRDLFLLLGGLFLIWKAIDELRVDMRQAIKSVAEQSAVSFRSAVMQIILLDTVFSLDSVMTAVGMAKEYWMMATAIIIAIILMLIASESISRFIVTYPRIRRLALCFLLLIGAVLVVESFAVEVSKIYTFIAFSFALFVELINIAYDKRKS